jgi:hypothetical protein
VKVRLVLAITVAAAFAAGCAGDDGRQGGGDGGDTQSARTSAAELLSRDLYMGYWNS